MNHSFLFLPSYHFSLFIVSGKLYIFSNGKVWIFNDRRPEMVTRINKVGFLENGERTASLPNKHLLTYHFIRDDLWRYFIGLISEISWWTTLC